MSKTLASQQLALLGDACFVAAATASDNVRHTRLTVATNGGNRATNRSQRHRSPSHSVVHALRSETAVHTRPSSGVDRPRVVGASPTGHLRQPRRSSIDTGTGAAPLTPGDESQVFWKSSAHPAKRRHPVRGAGAQQRAVVEVRVPSGLATQPGGLRDTASPSVASPWVQHAEAGDMRSRPASVTGFVQGIDVDAGVNASLSSLFSGSPLQATRSTDAVHDSSPEDPDGSTAAAAAAAAAANTEDGDAGAQPQRGSLECPATLASYDSVRYASARNDSDGRKSENSAGVVVSDSRRQPTTVRLSHDGSSPSSGDEDNTSAHDAIDGANCDDESTGELVGSLQSVRENQHGSLPCPEQESASPTQLQVTREWRGIATAASGSANLPAAVMVGGTQVIVHGGGMGGMLAAGDVAQASAPFIRDSQHVSRWQPDQQYHPQASKPLLGAMHEAPCPPATTQHSQHFLAVGNPASLAGTRQKRSRRLAPGRKPRKVASPRRYGIFVR